MSKKSFLNIFLLFVVIILVNMVINVKKSSTKLETLTKIDTQTINNITIWHNDSETHFIKDKNDTWNITKPINIAANNFRINSVLKLLNAPVHGRYRASEIDLEKTGLLAPVTTIQFNDIKISFGINNPVTSLRFVRIGEAISTIEDVYSPLLTSHFSTLISLNLLPANKAPFSGITKLILLNQTIKKNQQGKWQSNINITADNINKTLDHWQHDQAFGIHQYLKRKQLGELFIYTSKPDAVINYQITSTEPWLVLARPELGIEYHLDINTYDSLIAPQ